MRTIVKFIPLLFLASCFTMADSENTVLKEIHNKDNTKKAILYLKQAGATVDNSYQVSLTDSDYKISESDPGNVFTVDENHGSTHLTDSSIKLSWLSNDTLQIVYDKKLRTFIRETQKNGVTILYILN